MQLNLEKTPEGISVGESSGLLAGEYGRLVLVSRARREPRDDRLWYSKET